MAETSIGIKIADGSFYPVLTEGAPGRKRVILTTVSDNQTGAKIDLFRGNGTGIGGATYVGTLMIDEIEPAPKGSPEIELIMKLDERGNLDAEASDHVTGEHQTLSVALESLATEEKFELPEFDLEDRYQPDLGVSPAEESRLTFEPVSSELNDVEEAGGRYRRRRTLQYVALGVIVVAVAVIVVLLVYHFGRRPAATGPAETSGSAAPLATAPAAPAASAASNAPAAPNAPAASSASAGSASAPSTQTTGSSRSTPAAAKPGGTQYREGGVVYQIRWGDTLWDLSISFYRTPWLYGKIAKANNIRNPNLIFANTQIYIPER